MAIGSSTSGVQVAVQSGWQQLKLQQAMRNADQAEQQARALRAEARDAQSVADRAQEKARSIKVESNQADGKAGEARQGVSALRSLSRMSTNLVEAYGQIAQAMQTTQESVAEATAAASSDATANPVVNTQGQTTGTIVSVTA